MTEQRLIELGFLTELIYSVTIRRTAEKMHAAVENDPDLTDRVFDEIRDSLYPVPVDGGNWAQQLDNWIQEQATALHNERGLALIAPFKAIGSLFF